MSEKIVWLRMEYKRAAVMLPFILRRAMILAAVCLAAGSIIAFCAGLMHHAKGGEPKLRIGYAAADNMLTELAVSYVQDMESIQSLCVLEAVGEQEGRRLLEEGSLSALIVLPECRGRNSFRKECPGEAVSCRAGGGCVVGRRDSGSRRDAV